eukprot:GHVU01120280.1.p1 GENE.GHVU01120280.1~~GHVU01120280.1.p1  ORF type:complete len:124 (-),score=18.09 GHVU01120280.1:374-712(-)
MAAQPKHDKPDGMEAYDLGGPDDLGALSADQQEKLNQFKMKTRHENEKYLRDHPEVECLMAGFLSEVLNKRPDNIRDFAAGHFTEPELPTKLQKDLESRQEIIQRNKVLKKL